MYCNSYAAARKQAQANANFCGCDWVVFFDTSGNAQCERRVPTNAKGYTHRVGDLLFDAEVFSPRLTGGGS